MVCMKWRKGRREVVLTDSIERGKTQLNSCNNAVNRRREMRWLGRQVARV